MVAKILITRQFKPGHTPQIVALLNEIRTLALSQPGYQSGETLIKNNAPDKMVVISTWNSLEEWYRWRDNAKRKEFEAMLQVFQHGPTKYEEFLMGSPLHSG